MKHPVDEALAQARTLTEELGRKMAEIEAAVAGSRTVVQRLNLVARRLKHSETPVDWDRALLDGAREFCRYAALVRIANGRFRMASAGEEFPIDSAPALRSALDSRDTVVAAATARELSPELAAGLGDAAGTRAYLFPVSINDSVIAVLCASGDADAGGLELLTALAGGAAPPIPRPPEDLVQIAPAPEKAARARDWDQLTKSEQHAHLRAQQFARTAAARILLENGSRLRGGRAARDIYGTLKVEIDAAREAFRLQFMANCASMVDYFHLEIARTLAAGDATRLGPSYPGPLAV